LVNELLDAPGELADSPHVRDDVQRNGNVKPFFGIEQKLHDLHRIEA
jgi:hypothetical protein